MILFIHEVNFTYTNNYYAAVVKILTRTFICNNFTLVGSVLSPRARPILLVTCFSWIFAVLLYWIFSSNLMAFLAVTKIKLPFTTLWEMAEQKEYAYGWSGQTSIEDTFRVISLSLFNLCKFVKVILYTNIEIDDCSLLKVEVIKPYGITLIQNGSCPLQHRHRRRETGLCPVNLLGSEMTTLCRYWLLIKNVILFSFQSDLIRQIMPLLSRKIFPI